MATDHFRSVCDADMVYSLPAPNFAKKFEAQPLRQHLSTVVGAPSTASADGMALDVGDEVLEGPDDPIQPEELGGNSTADNFTAFLKSEVLICANT